MTERAIMTHCLPRAVTIAAAIFFAPTIAAEPPANCRGVLYYSQVSSTPVRLECGFNNPLPIFNPSFQVPEGVSGYAFARAQLTVRNLNTSQIYFWNAGVQVGNAPEVNYRMGDDIPVGKTVTKSNAGYRFVKPGDLVSVSALQGSNPCVDHQVEVLHAYLWVWIEDSQEACRKQDIRVTSFFNNVGRQPEIYKHWTTSMQPIVRLSMTSATANQRLLVHSIVEGTVTNNPNTPTNQGRATIASQITSDRFGIIDTQLQTMPPSTGMGHLVLGSTMWKEVAPGAAGTWRFALEIGSNFDPNTCDYNDLRLVVTGGNVGDAILAVIRYSP
jgi:hypothetical protein